MKFNSLVSRSERIKHRMLGNIVYYGMLHPDDNGGPTWEDLSSQGKCSPVEGLYFIQALLTSGYVLERPRQDQETRYYATDKGATAFFNNEFLIRGEELLLKRYSFWLSVVAALASLIAIVISVFALSRS